MRVATGEIDDWTNQTLDGKSLAAVELGRKGGAARADSLSKARRIAIAKKAAKSRWSLGLASFNRACFSRRRLARCCPLRIVPDLHAELAGHLGRTDFHPHRRLALGCRDIKPLRHEDTNQPSAVHSSWSWWSRDSPNLQCALRLRKAGASARHRANLRAIRNN